MATEEDRMAYQEGMQKSPFYEVDVARITGVNVISEDGEDVGEIEHIGVRGDTIVAIIAVGGFLGMGEKMVALPIDSLGMRGDQVYLPKLTEDELENMPEFNEAEVQVADDGRVADLLQ
jgi:hypothetical protein